MIGRVYASCVRSSLIYGSEAMPLLADVWLKFEGAAMRMIRWKCVVSLKDRRTSEELRKFVGLEPITTAGPQEWNKLPIYILKSSSLSIFKTQLKTYLFILAYPSIILLNVLSVLSYLHLFIIIIIFTSPLFLHSQSYIFTS